jgi:hypothetical protein
MRADEPLDSEPRTPNYQRATLLTVNSTAQVKLPIGEFLHIRDVSVVN